MNALDIPIIMGELGGYLGESGFGKSAVEYKQVNEVLADVAHTEDHCYLVTSKGLTANPDGIHMDAISHRKFGLRYYKAFLKRTNVVDQLNQEEGWIERTADCEWTINEEIFVLSTKFATGEIHFDEFSIKMANILERK